MAEKRMFTQKIIDSDAFLDMPLSTQALYFHLNMRADDDGFINNPKRIVRAVGACEDDLKLLIVKRFVIGFESGVIVIKHWRMHNTLRKDRYNPTQYQEELETLAIKDNGAYTDAVEIAWQPNGNQMATTRQPSIDKYSLVECSKEEISVVEGSAEGREEPRSARFTPPTLDEVRAYCAQRGKGVDPDKWYDHYTANGWMVGRNKMKDWKAAVRTWESGDKGGKNNGTHRSPAATQKYGQYI